MPWIKEIADHQATGLLKTLFDQAIQRAGKVFNIVRVMSLNPPATKSSMTLYGTLMFGLSPLSRGQREMLATVVSVQNQCLY